MRGWSELLCCKSVVLLSHNRHTHSVHEIRMQSLHLMWASAFLIFLLMITHRIIAIKERFFSFIKIARSRRFSAVWHCCVTSVYDVSVITLIKNSFSHTRHAYHHVHSTYPVYYEYACIFFNVVNCLSISIAYTLQMHVTFAYLKLSKKATIPLAVYVVPFLIVL
jgi:hypothetical protein